MMALIAASLAVRTTEANGRRVSEAMRISELV